MIAARHPCSFLKDSTGFNMHPCGRHHVLKVGHTQESTTSTSYTGVAYSRVRPTRVWRTLEYTTTKDECTLESKSCLEYVVAPTPASICTSELCKEGYIKLQLYCIVL